MDKLKLLSGMPIEVEKVGKIHPFTLCEIAEMGQLEFYRMMSLLTFDPTDLDNFKNLKSDDGTPLIFETYDVLLLQMMFSNDKELKSNILNALSAVFREPVHFISDPGLFYLGEITDNRYILKIHYEEIKKIIKIQNGLQRPSEKIEEEYNPASEEARRIMEKLRAGREAVQKNREKNGEKALYLDDLISIVAGKGNNLNLLNIWHLTMYQFNDTFKRLQLIDDYDISLSSLLAGADSKKVKLTHWMSKIDD